MKQLFLFLFLLFYILESNAQKLSRKAWLGVVTNEKNNQLNVDSVVANSTASILGLLKEDVLVSINDINLFSNKQLINLTNELREGQNIRIKYKRNNHVNEVKGFTVCKPVFQSDWCDAVYQSLDAIGCTVRTIIYKPKDKKQTPGIFFIPGYNCGSIENFASNFNGKMIEHWVKAGYTVYTVEKSGLGDSKGCKPCIEVDLQTDIELFETAYNDFSKLQYLDKNNLFIWGHSMGGIIAPIIAQHKKVKGMMVFGTVYRPWSEFLLEMHRVQKPLTDSMSAAQTEDFVRLIQKVYYEFFIQKKSPAQLYENSEYKKIVETELEYQPVKQEMWGRHWRFWQQLDSINLAQDWQNLNCKVLVLHGASDFIQCSSVEPYLIAEAINKTHPGNATLITIPELDHLMMKSKDFPEAVRNMNNKEYLKGNFNVNLVEATLKWMRKIDAR